MEDRLSRNGHAVHSEVRGAPAEGKPGLALVALVAIALITVAWWALALKAARERHPYAA